jgi:tetratricopeptide (TPR) repeat protein
MRASERKDLLDRYRQLRLAGIAKIRTGEYQGALEDFEQALAAARRAGTPRLLHEAQANVSMAYIQLGEDRKAESGLREILLRSQEPRLRFGAAYNLAVSLRKQGRYGRARQYAAHAMENARRLRDASRRGGCHNLLGNILMNQSCLEEALVEYRKALAIRRRQKQDVRFSIAIILENIGYTYLLQKKYSRGAVMIGRALSIALEIDDKRCIAESHQDLCYANMLMNRYSDAVEMGNKALEIASARGYRDIETNCYYLLGETAHLAGRPEERDRQFERLQSLHPELPFLRDFLCAFDLSGIITLKR